MRADIADRISAIDPGYGRWPFRMVADEVHGVEPRVLHVHLKTHVEPQDALVNSLKYIAGEYRQIDWMKLPRGELNRALVAACTDFSPTLVFMQLQTADVLEPAALKHAKTFCPDATFVTWCGDIGRDNGPSYAAPSAKYIHYLCDAGLDLALYSSWTQVVAHRTHGLHCAAYLQIGYDDHIYRPAPPHEYGSKYDVVFLGQNYDEKAWPTVKDNDIQLRRDVVVDLRAHFGDRFGLFGTAWSGGREGASGGPAEYVTSLKTREIYVAAKAAVSLSLVSNYDKYSSDRLLRSLACGTPTFVKRFYDMQSWGLRDGVNCIVWDDSINLIHKLRTLVNEPYGDRKYMLGIRGAKLVQENHTWTVRMRELLPLVHVTRGKPVPTCAILDY